MLIAGADSVACVRVPGAPTQQRREVPPPGTGQESAAVSMAQRTAQEHGDMPRSTRPRRPAACVGSRPAACVGIGVL